jgi:hypothetical protein
MELVFFRGIGKNSAMISIFLLKRMSTSIKVTDKGA